jgi:tetratricopeptide (TPR) repeat protein
LLLNPQDATVYFSRALAYHKTGKHNEAIADYSKTLELEPECSQASKNKALALQQLAMRQQTDKLTRARSSPPGNRQTAACRDAGNSDVGAGTKSGARSSRQGGGKADPRVGAKAGADARGDSRAGARADAKPSGQADAKSGGKVYDLFTKLEIAD